VERRYEDVAILRESKQLSPASRNGLEVPLAGEGHYLLPGIGSATLTPGRAPEVPASPECAHLDPGRIADLVLRTRRPGDRIRLLGGPGTRKLSDLFIDCKVPRDQRDRWPLLAVAGQARVLWVPGLRVGEGPWAAPGAESLRLGISWPRP